MSQERLTNSKILSIENKIAQKNVIEDVIQKILISSSPGRLNFNYLIIYTNIQLHILRNNLLL